MDKPAHIPLPLQQQLQDLLGDRYGIQPHTLQAHSQDESWHQPTTPAAVCFAQTREEVQAIVQACQASQVPITPFGAGTSVEGHSIPSPGAISLDLSQMNTIEAIWTDDMSCQVQAGVTRLQLNQALRSHGLFFPVDPGANATLGGMCATRASGTCAVRYGTMKHNVLGLTAVLADGSVIHTGSRAKKSAAGYDLTSLLIGSEGTLGIITDITLQLHPLPETIALARVAFSSLENTLHMVVQLLQSAIPVARIELLDAAQILAVNQHQSLHLPIKPTLFIEFHGSAQYVQEQAQWAQEIANQIEPTEFIWSNQQEEMNALWLARHQALYAAKALVPNSRIWTTDVCVPLSQLPECLLQTQQDIDESQLQAPIVGHVGDGNFHLLIVLPKDDKQSLAKAQALNERLIERALKAGGTCTGEHGIGLGKKAALQQEAGPALLVMKTLKQALDPNNLLNPGKMFDLP